MGAKHVKDVAQTVTKQNTITEQTWAVAATTQVGTQAMLGPPGRNAGQCRVEQSNAARRSKHH